MIEPAIGINLPRNSEHCTWRKFSMFPSALARVALASLICSTAAFAQSSATNCQPVGNGVECNTQTRQSSGIDPTIPLRVAPPPQFDWNAYRQMQAQRQAQQAQEHQQQVEASHAEAMAEIKDAVIQRLRDGDCKNAIDIALLSGDIDLATQAKNYCAAPAPTK